MLIIFNIGEFLRRLYGRFTTTCRVFVPQMIKGSGWTFGALAMTQFFNSMKRRINRPPAIDNDQKK